MKASLPSPTLIYVRFSHLENASSAINSTECGIEKVKQFSPDKIVENWEKLYKEIKEEKHV